MYFSSIKCQVDLILSCTGIVTRPCNQCYFMLIIFSITHDNKQCSVVKVETIKTYRRSCCLETNKKNVASVHRFNCEYKWLCCVLFIVSIRRRVISQSLLYLQQKERYTSKLYIGTKTIKEQFTKRKRKETSPRGPRVSHVSRIN